ncbi:MAG: hypothetical protein PWP07_2509 [Epulopiscium sp.]|nr:hypothetical protein [Rikenellaceae bacterium]MDK2789264.1 hypothetical protein [Candidatus Epulonipiscium sp.]
MIWNKEAECMSNKEKEELQLKLLKEVVKRPMKMFLIIKIVLIN